MDTYEVPTGQLPDCWYRHGSMTADLAALRAGWTAAYLDPEAEPDRPSRWHDTLERTLRRIRDWDRHGCGRGGSHTEQTNTPANELECPDAHRFDQYLRQVEGELSHTAATVPRPFARKSTPLAGHSPLRRTRLMCQACPGMTPAVVVDELDARFRRARDRNTTAGHRRAVENLR